MTTTTCPHCSAAAQVDLSRIPAGRSARITCPGCQQQYPVPGTATPAQGATVAAPAPAPAASSDDRAWLRKELEALRVELERACTANVLAALGVKSAARTDDPETDPERRHALVCEADPAFAQVLCTALSELGYMPQVVADLPSAWRALDREWGAIVLAESLPDEKDAGSKLQERLSRLPGSKRRRMFIVHVSNEVRSLDGGMAFVLNANVTLNRADAAHCKEIIKKGMTDHERLYRHFHAVQEAMHV